MTGRKLLSLGGATVAALLAAGAGVLTGVQRQGSGSIGSRGDIAYWVTGVNTADGIAGSCWGTVEPDDANAGMVAGRSPRLR